MKFKKKKIFSLTFGFELEGRFALNFNPGVRESLSDGSQWHYDGSVCINSSDLPVSVLSFEEYCSPVFKKETHLMARLARFKNDKNYFMDDTCGLHLHIGASSKNQKILQNLCASYDFLTAFYDLALTFCPCQKARLKNKNNYCLNYEKYNFIGELKNKEKYRFCRWHPQGTLEFRFLSPCVHKIENTEKTIAFFKKYLSAYNRIADLTLPADMTSREKLNLTVSGGKKDENLILNYVLS